MRLLLSKMLPDYDWVEWVRYVKDAYVMSKGFNFRGLRSAQTYFETLKNPMVLFVLLLSVEALWGIKSRGVFLSVMHMEGHKTEFGGLVNCYFTPLLFIQSQGLLQ